MLAQVEVDHPDEMRADFQQFYTLNIDDMGISYSHSHAAVLVSQLPRGSRVLSSEEPNLRWGDAEFLLSAIEYDLRVLAWQKTKDASSGGRKPEPPITPTTGSYDGESIEHMASVADALGISIGDDAFIT